MGINQHPFHIDLLLLKSELLIFDDAHKEASQANRTHFFSPSRKYSAQDLQKKQVEMMRPLYDKAKTAIEKVASAQGFDYVLDATAGGSVIMAKGKDLMSDVKAELGF